MFDTLKFWLPSEQIKESGYLERIPTLLDNVEERYKKGKDEVYFTGYFLGLKTSVSASGLSMEGSLCKSYLNDNFNTLTRQDTQRAIEQLQDLLKVPLLEANVRRIDVAQNFMVKEPVSNYFAYLGSSQYYQRLIQPQSLYYSNKQRTKLFYDKVAEGKAKGYEIPHLWKNKNVLRYELRFTSRLLKQFNTEHLKAFNLYDEVFYINLIDVWYNEFKNIHKNHTILEKMNVKQIETPKDFIYQLALLQIKQNGINETLEIVEQLKVNNQFKHKEYYSRLKSDIKRLCEAEFLTEDNALITELEAKVKRATEYYR